MLSTPLKALLALSFALPVANAHISLFHPSMYGFNVTDKTFPEDNRPVVPLVDRAFNDWWYHGFLDFPPHKEDVMQLEVGKPVTTELACNKGATSFFDSDPGGDIRQGDWPCPNDPSTGAMHTNGIEDTKGCALAIAYKSDARDVQPEDFTVFSVNHTCVWNRFTDFQVPAKMPPCPNNMCQCAWFWIHSPDSGSEQMFMTGFQCNIVGSVSNVPVAKPGVPRRCGLDQDAKTGKIIKPADPTNCTQGAQQPLYWLQKERNNMFEGLFSPPFYNDLYGFADGPQNLIFEDSFDANGNPSSPISNAPQGIPVPSANGTIVSPSTSAPDSASASVPTSTPTRFPNAPLATTLPANRLCRRRGPPTSLAKRHLRQRRSVWSWLSGSGIGRRHI